MNAVAELCPRCALCCDSTLFADVELRKGDDAAGLEKAGLSLQAKTVTKLAFAQPCACLAGKLCRTYASRPTQCRRFECGILKRVASGQMTTPAALKKIGEAQRLADRVRALLRQAGQGDEAMALTHRYAAVMRLPLDLSVEGAAEARGQLIMTVNDLMQLLQREFLKKRLRG